MNTITEDLTITPGKYYIGDPCYIWPDDKWDEFCNELDYGNGQILEFEGKGLYVFSTAFGDGVYDLIQNDLKIRYLSVDAGLLSIIPLDLIESMPNHKLEGIRTETYYKIIEITEDIKINEVGKGHIKFGEYSINTDECIYDGEYDGEYDEELDWEESLKDLEDLDEEE